MRTGTSIPSTCGSSPGRRRPSDNVPARPDRKSTRLNSSHANISYAVFCLKKTTQQFGRALAGRPAAHAPSDRRPGDRVLSVPCPPVPAAHGQHTPAVAHAGGDPEEHTSEL